MFLYKVATVMIPNGIRLATSSNYFPLDSGNKKLFMGILKKNMIRNLLQWSSEIFVYLKIYLQKCKIGFHIFVKTFFFSVSISC